MTRGQTTIDFAVGVSIFLFALAFVFAFVPGTLQPFTGSVQDETAGSDRVADLVVEDLLTEPGDPYVLDGACTAALLSDGSSPDCEFDGSTLRTRLDLPSSQSINVTIRGDPSGSGVERLCWNRDDRRVVGVDGTCSVVLAAGEATPTSSASVVTARRVVTIEDTIAAIEVRMW